MPTYKVDKQMIESAINSVKAQFFTDWELLIIDDNPENSKWKIETSQLDGENTDSRIRFFYHKDNQGANAARNTGIHNSKGLYLAFLDSDDQWDENFLEHFHLKIIKTDSDIVSCRYYIVRNAGQYLIQKQSPPEGRIYQQLAFQDFVGPTSAVVVRKESLLKAGCFDENLPARQDYDMWLRICKDGMFQYIDEPLMFLSRLGQDSISKRGNNHVIGTDIVLNKLLKDPDLAKYKGKLKYVHNLDSAIYLLNESNTSKAREYLRKALDGEIHLKIFIYYLFTFFPLFYDFLRKKRLTILMRNSMESNV